MAFYLLKIHKVIQIMSKKRRGAENCWHAAHANVRQIARLPEQRCWQKGEMLESCQQRQQRRKKQISGQKKSFQPMLFARLARRTREHQPERIACLGIESSGSRTHGLPLRSGVVHLPFVSLGVPRNADIARIFPVPNPIRYLCCTVQIRPFSG